MGAFALCFLTKTLTITSFFTFLYKDILSILRFPLDTRRCGALLFRALRSNIMLSGVNIPEQLTLAFHKQGCTHRRLTLPAPLLGLCAMHYYSRLLAQRW